MHHVEVGLANRDEPERMPSVAAKEAVAEFYCSDEVLRRAKEQERGRGIVGERIHLWNEIFIKVL